jgi:hypothetical protein
VTGHPFDYYEAKRRLLAAQWRNGRRVVDYGYGEGVDRMLVDVLEWPAPEPVTDERGKRIKVFAADVAYTLTDEARVKYRVTVPRGVQQPYGVRGYIVAPTKKAAAEWHREASDFRWGKPSDWTEVEVTDLVYPIAATSNLLIVNDPAEHHTRTLFLPVPPEDMRDPSIALPRMKVAA